MNNLFIIKENKKPRLKMVEFVVDKELDQRLNNYEINTFLNRSNFTLFLGRAGSGKTSLATGLLGTNIKNGGFKKVFHTIICFIPQGSRNSMKDNFFEKYLKEEQIYDELTEENLSNAYSIANENANENYNTLIILDDVQKNLKGECEKLLLSMINNRRHARLTIWLLCQNYFSIPKQVRAGLTNLFVFKVGKNEMEQIFTEQVEQHKSKFLEILNLCYTKAHDFLFIDTNSQRLFSNWNEILLNKI